MTAKEIAKIGRDTIALILIFPFFLIGFVVGLAVVLVKVIIASIKVGYERAIGLLEKDEAT